MLEILLNIRFIYLQSKFRSPNDCVVSWVEFIYVSIIMQMYRDAVSVIYATASKQIVRIRCFHCGLPVL